MGYDLTRPNCYIDAIFNLEYHVCVHVSVWIRVVKVGLGEVCAVDREKSD